jgi:SpoVK/Ycf46/Vps4 family AAA+-type ATPase
MARGDLLKQLLRSFKKRDDQAFYDVANELIAEERKKHHVVLANDLERILLNGSAVPNNSTGYSVQTFEAPPRDTERQTPLVEIRKQDRYLSELVLDDAVQGVIKRIISEFREWDVLEANGLSPTRRVLFCGPSGCGKTATAEAVSSELGLPLLYVRFDAVVSSLLGETASNVRKVFEYARHNQWVMFFDEFDAIGRSRDDITEHGEIKRVVNSFLQIMDNFNGKSLIIAATNFEQALDPAIWRRFDDIVRFEKPEPGHIEALIQKKLRPLQFQKSQVITLSKKLIGQTFADVERVCFDIRKSCAIRGEQKVQKMDLNEAIERNIYRWKVLNKASSLHTPSVDEE